MAVREVLVPGSLREAVALRAAHRDELLVMAGGTVVMPLITDGAVQPRQVLSLRRAGLDGIVVADDSVRLGAMATLSALLAADLGGPAGGLLRDAARHTAAWAVRNRATVGGNLLTPPRGGDLAVALLALDATARIASARGDREVRLEAFWRAPEPGDAEEEAAARTILAPDELVAGIRVPLPPRGTAVAFHKFGRRTHNTPAVVTVAVAVQRAAGGPVTGARIALGGAGPFPVRARAAETAIEGSALDSEAVVAAAQAAAAEARPRRDAIASAWYRTRMVELFVRRALEQLAAPESTEAAA